MSDPAEVPAPAGSPPPVPPEREASSAPSERVVPVVEDARRTLTPTPGVLRSPVGRRTVPPIDEDPAASARRRVLDRLSRPDNDDGESLRVGRTPSAPHASVRPRSSTPPPPSSMPFAPTSATPTPRLPLSSRDPLTPRLGQASVRDRVRSSERRGAFPPTPSERAVASSFSLSPRMTAVFGGLFGLATVTTIIALLIQSAPPRDERTLLSASPASLTASASASGAPVAPPVSKKRIRVKLPGPWRIADGKDPGIRVVEGTMDRKSFFGALSEKGVPKDQLYRVLKSFEGVRKFDKSQRSDKFIVALDSGKSVKAFEYVVSPTEIYQAREENGLLVGKKLDLAVADAEVTGSIYVGKNLGKSIEDAGLEPALVKAIDEAFAGRFSSESIKEGGVIRIVAVETTVLGEFVKYKKVVAAEYQPPDPAAPSLRAYAYESARARGYFDDKGRQPDGSGFQQPVPGAPITSRFNPKRLHPVLKKVMPHNGTDFGAPNGTPIYAAYRGKISHFGPAGPCGNMVQIDHPGGVQTGYCHMSKFADGLKSGSPVGTKQLIGYVGSTGRSTGAHLHFYAKKDGKFFDAETLKMNGFRVLPAEDRDTFAAMKTMLDARLDALPMPDPPPAAPTEAPKEDPKPSDPSMDDTAKASDDPAPSDTAKPGKDAPLEEGEDLVGPDLSR